MILVIESEQDCLLTEGDEESPSIVGYASLTGLIKDQKISLPLWQKEGPVGGDRFAGRRLVGQLCDSLL